MTSEISQLKMENSQLKEDKMILEHAIRVQSRYTDALDGWVDVVISRADSFGTKYDKLVKQIAVVNTAVSSYTKWAAEGLAQILARLNTWVGLDRSPSWLPGDWNVRADHLSWAAEVDTSWDPNHVPLFETIPAFSYLSNRPEITSSTATIDADDWIHALQQYFHVDNRFAAVTQYGRTVAPATYRRMEQVSNQLLRLRNIAGWVLRLTPAPVLKEVPTPPLRLKIPPRPQRETPGS